MHLRSIKNVNQGFSSSSWEVLYQCCVYRPENKEKTKSYESACLCSCFTEPANRRVLLQQTHHRLLSCLLPKEFKFRSPAASIQSQIPQCICHGLGSHVAPWWLHPVAECSSTLFPDRVHAELCPQRNVMLMASCG